MLGRVGLIFITMGFYLYLMTGISDKCSNRGVALFTELLSNWSGSQGYCMYADENLFYCIYDVYGHLIHRWLYPTSESTLVLKISHSTLP